MIFFFDKLTKIQNLKKWERGRGEGGWGTGGGKSFFVTFFLFLGG